MSSKILLKKTSLYQRKAVDSYYKKNYDLILVKDRDRKRRLYTRQKLLKELKEKLSTILVL